jgi:hypothetical protein
MIPKGFVSTEINKLHPNYIYCDWLPQIGHYPLNTVAAVGCDKLQIPSANSDAFSDNPDLSVTLFHADGSKVVLGAKKSIALT